MTYTTGNTFYGQPGRHLGNKVIYITSDGITEQYHGYRIISYNGLQPNALEYVATVADDTYTDWDTVYDALFGNPLTSAHK